MHAYTNMYMHIPVRGCVCVCACALENRYGSSEAFGVGHMFARDAGTCIHQCMHIHTCMHLHVCLCVGVCMRAYVCMCILSQCLVLCADPTSS
jgi:hypothetical protein